jgi:hypothetical protein
MSKEKEVLESGRLGQVLRAGDFLVKRGTLFARRGGLFIADHQIDHGNSGPDLPEGTLVGYNIVRGSGRELGMSTRTTRVKPEELVTPVGVITYSTVQEMLPPIAVRRKKAAETKHTRRNFGFQKD